LTFYPFNCPHHDTRSSRSRYFATPSLPKGPKRTQRKHSNSVIDSVGSLNINVPLSRPVLRPQKPRIETLLQSHSYRISTIYVMDTFTSVDDLTTCLPS